MCVSTYSYTMSANSENFTFIFPEEKIWHFSAVEIGFLVCFGYFALLKWADYYFIHLAGIQKNDVSAEKPRGVCQGWQTVALHHTSIGYEFCQNYL